MLVNKFFGCIICVSLLTLKGCAPQIHKPIFPQISFAHLPTIGLQVSRIEVENLYITPTTRSHIEYKLPISLGATASNWGRDRLKALGHSGVVRLVVRRASLIEVPLKHSGGLKSVFTRDQSERYDAVIDILVELRDAAGKVRVTAESVATRSRSVSENISLVEREKLWFEMVNEMMVDLNKSLEQQIRKHMKNWLS